MDYKLVRLLFYFSVLFFLNTTGVKAQLSSTDTISLNGIWKFKTDMYENGMEEKWYNPASATDKWVDIAVPGSWDTYNEYAYYTGDAWYRHEFYMPEKLVSRHIRLVFESVYNYAEIWLNGSKIGENDLGFLAFQFDINKYLKFGKENVLVLKVNNAFKLGATWNWGGIRRPVWLEISNTRRINYASVNAVPDLIKGTADISVSAEMANYSGKDVAVSYGVNVYYKGKQVGQSGRQMVDRLIKGDTLTAKAIILLSKPNVHLWHFEHPELYDLVIDLYEKDVKIHSLKERFGIRKIEVDGFKLKLNGEEIRTVGFNIVPEDRVFGNSMPLDRFKTMVDLMKESGANMARLSHFSLPASFLDYLDEKGIMTFEEVSLWGKNTLVDPNHPLPKLWLTRLIRQQYNHPCVIGWSVGNEIGSYQNNPLVYDYVKEAISLAKKSDPGRLVTYASNTAPSQPNDAAGLCDIILLNKYDNWGKAAELVHKNFPSKLIFMSEFGADLNDENLDNSSVPINKMMEAMRDKPYLAGASLWTFNDYRSNYWSAKSTWNTPPSENRTWGIVNSVFQPKKSYYEVKRAYQPFVVNKFLAIVDGGRLVGEISIESRSLQSIPAYRIDGYTLHIVPTDKAGKAPGSAEFPVPSLQPGEKSDPLKYNLQMDTGIHSVSFKILDKLGYSRYDTIVFVKKPLPPQVIGVFKNLKSFRVVFAKHHSASKYYIKYGTNRMEQLSDTAMLNHFITIDNLNPDSTYQFQLVAENNAGIAEGPVESIRLMSSELPPIVWAVVPVVKGFFISFSSDPLDYKYEVEYGEKTGEYEKRIILGNRGGIGIPDLKSGEKYFLRMRRILQWGFASEWTNELQVITK